MDNLGGEALDLLLQKTYFFGTTNDLFFFMVRAAAAFEPLNVVFASR